MATRDFYTFNIGQLEGREHELNEKTREAIIRYRTALQELNAQYLVDLSLIIKYSKGYVQNPRIRLEASKQSYKPLNIDMINTYVNTERTHPELNLQSDIVAKPIFNLLNYAGEITESTLANLKDIEAQLENENRPKPTYDDKGYIPPGSAEDSYFILQSFNRTGRGSFRELQESGQ